MSNVRAFLTLRFYAVLPDDDQAADDAFDSMGDDVVAILNRASIVGVVQESFSVETGDTEPDE